MSCFADSLMVKNGAPEVQQLQRQVSASTAATAPLRPSSVT